MTSISSQEMDGFVIKTPTTVFFDETTDGMLLTRHFVAEDVSTFVGIPACDDALSDRDVVLKIVDICKHNIAPVSRHAKRRDKDGIPPSAYPARME